MENADVCGTFFWGTASPSTDKRPRLVLGGLSACKYTEPNTHKQRSEPHHRMPTCELCSSPTIYVPEALSQICEECGHVSNTSQIELHFNEEAAWAADSGRRIYDGAQTLKTWDGKRTVWGQSAEVALRNNKACFLVFSEFPLSDECASSEDCLYGNYKRPYSTRAPRLDTTSQQYI
jgi:hypothetical protein